MYIKGNKGTRQIVVRSVGGDRVDPITVNFSAAGIANVKDGVGELMVDMFPAISEIHPEDNEEDA